MTEFTGKTAVVTGATRGIGRAIAESFLQHKCKVVGVYGSNQEEAKRFRAQWPADQLQLEHCNVADHDQVARFYEGLESRFDTLDILVNNAGIQIDTESGILELDPVIFQNTLETNALGPLLMAQATVPIMKVNGFGRIVNLVSTLGSLAEIASPDSPYNSVLSPAYRLSKTLLNGITVLLAKELRGSNILVNSVCPGWVRTDMGGSAASIDTGASAAGLVARFAALNPATTGCFETFEGKAHPY